ncbi:MAG: TonB-dependent receptor [Verrucomicrobia bacterium]|nr:TonB-dependent receptor [Verrucomicrobiota bacterium]
MITKNTGALGNGRFGRSLATLSALTVAAGAAFAQDAEPQRVVVTGTYIPTAESEGPLPVTVYSASVLQKIGANTPVEGLRQLPSFVGNTATENDSNGGDGSAFVAIRGLGPANTLTLINGRRAFGFANVNAIPIGALDRSEILKDGAGAIYGSDAVAGVVNFILINGPGSTPLNGVEIDLLYGNTTDKDARVIQGYIRGGFSNDKLSIAFAAEYYDRNAIFSRDRSISASSDRRFLGGNNGGSGTFPGRVTLGGVARILVDQSVASPQNAAAYRAYGGANSPDPFNFRAFTPAIPAQEKYMYYITGQYNIFGKAMTAYADVMYAKTKQDNGLAPAPFALGRAAILASPYNPFVATTPTSNPNRISGLSYRLTDELGLRKSFYDYDYWRYTFGLRGEFVFKGNPFIDFLGYDGGFVYERLDQLRIDSGDAQRNLIEAEIAAGNFNPFRGQFAPTSGTSNTFNPVTGAVTGTRSWDNVAAAQRSSYVGRSFFYSHDFLIDARLFGNLFPTLPQGGIGFNIGTEFRQTRTTQLPDSVQAQGNQLGFNASPNTKYKQEVKSFFAEVSVPIITQKMKVPFIQSFDFSAAIRYEQFENFDQKPDPSNVARGNPTRAKFDSGVKPRFTVRYQPINDLTLRGSYGESFRAPGPVALFDPIGDNFPNISDPFRQTFTQPPGGVKQGGNVLLTPEESKSWTAGLVFTPRWVKGLTLTVDYYQVRTLGVFLGGADFAQLAASINGNSLRAGAAFPGTFGYVVDPNNPEGTPPAGRFVGRNPLVGNGGGEIFTIYANTANAAKRFVQGIDTTLTYQLPWNQYGQFTASLGANYFLSWKAEAIPGVGTTDFLGDFNGSLPLAPGGIPRLKGFFRLEYAWKGWEWVGTINYIGGYNDDSSALLAANVIGGGDTTPVYDLYRKVPSYVTFDSQLSYEFKKPKADAAKEIVDGKGVRTQVAADNSGSFAQKLLWGTKIKVGVVNMFDRSPPVVLGAFNDNYDTSNYSIRNRYWYIGINKKF